MKSIARHAGDCGEGHPEIDAARKGSQEVIRSVHWMRDAVLGIVLAGSDAAAFDAGAHRHAARRFHHGDAGSGVHRRRGE